MSPAIRSYATCYQQRSCYPKHGVAVNARRLARVARWYHLCMSTCDNDSHFGSGRTSEQRRAIAAAADAFGSAFTVDDLVAAARRTAPRIGVATVYRAVAAMESAGALERVGSREGSALYARCDRSEHHHHLVCTGCGKTAHAPCPLGPDAAGVPSEQDGFVVTSHEITLYGLCRECSAATAANTPDRRRRRESEPRRS